eukprot:7376229-Prymnesium_polylepis.1
MEWARLRAQRNASVLRHGEVSKRRAECTAQHFGNAVHRRTCDAAAAPPSPRAADAPSKHCPAVGSCARGGAAMRGGHSQRVAVLSRKRAPGVRVVGGGTIAAHLSAKRRPAAREPRARRRRRDGVQRSEGGLQTHGKRRRERASVKCACHLKSSPPWG